MSQEIIERLALVKQRFSRALIIGLSSEPLEAFLQSKGITYVNARLGAPALSNRNSVVCDEDRLPFADQSFDLIISIGTLDSVNDVPGALVLIRRILKHDGLFLGAMIGADSIALIKTIVQTIEPQISRTHPLIDVRGAGDLLARAGFAMPVADADMVKVRYAKLMTLINDLRNNGLSNCLSVRPPMMPNWLKQAQSLFATSSREETFTIIYLSGWCPVASGITHTNASRNPMRGRSAGGMSIE